MVEMFGAQGSQDVLTASVFVPEQQEQQDL
jgi:hypothetical protein